MGFADELVADLKACGAPEEPDILDELVERWAYSRLPSGPGYPRDLVREQIILQLAFPVWKLTLRYRNRNNADDILGVALLSLVECVDRWSDEEDDANLRHYVEFTVKKRMKDFADNDGVLVIPSRRVREKRAAGKEVEDIGVVPADIHDEEETDSPSVPPDHSYDIIEFFESRGDAASLQIARMRADGRPVEEIAEEVGKPVWWIYNRLRQMEADFRDDGPRAAEDEASDELILELNFQGFRPWQIGRRLGRSTAWVRQRLRDLERDDTREGATCTAC